MGKSTNIGHFQFLTVRLFTRGYPIKIIHFQDFPVLPSETIHFGLSPTFREPIFGWHGDRLYTREAWLRHTLDALALALQHLPEARLWDPKITTKMRFF